MADLDKTFINNHQASVIFQTLLMKQFLMFNIFLQNFFYVDEVFFIEIYLNYFLIFLIPNQLKIIDVWAAGSEGGAEASDSVTGGQGATSLRDLRDLRHGGRQR